jgi:hypothetical protein
MARARTTGDTAAAGGELVWAVATYSKPARLITSSRIINGCAFMRIYV